MVLFNGDVCRSGQYAIIHDSPRKSYVGRIEEILRVQDNHIFWSGHPHSVLVHRMNVDETSPSPASYGMPSVKPTGIYHSDLLCTVNVQHNCKANGCGPTGSVPIYQERTRTASTKAIIEHLKNPDDLILNTAQMRDAVHVQSFREPVEALDSNNIVHAAVQEIVDVRKEAAKKKAVAS
ncbi:hypothetical protein C8J56DRAFT_718377, partial [Mycena floridula]